MKVVGVNSIYIARKKKLCTFGRAPVNRHNKTFYLTVFKIQFHQHISVYIPSNKCFEIHCFRNYNFLTGTISPVCVCVYFMRVIYNAIRVSLNQRGLLLRNPKSHHKMAESALNTCLKSSPRQIRTV